MFNKIEINGLKVIHPNTFLALWVGACGFLLIMLYVWKQSPSFLVSSIASLAVLNLGAITVLWLANSPKISVFMKIKNMTLGELKKYNDSFQNKGKSYRMDYLKKREIETVLVNLAGWAGFKAPEYLPIDYKPMHSSTLNFNDPDDINALDSKNNLQYFYLLDQILSANHLDGVKISDFNKLGK